MEVRKKLGSLLIESGLISESQLQTKIREETNLALQNLQTNTIFEESELRSTITGSDAPLLFGQLILLFNKLFL